MSNEILNRDQFFTPRKPKLIQVELPDMGATVNIIKGTVSLIRALDKVQAPDDYKLPTQVAMILVDSDGNLLCQSPEDVAKLSDMMTLDDMKRVIDKFAELNGISKEAMQQAIKNSQASQNGVSVSA